MRKRNAAVPGKSRHVNAPATREFINGLGQLAEVLSDAFLLLDKNLDLLMTNPAGEKLLGLSRKASKSGHSKNLLEIIPSIRESPIHRKLLRVLESGKPFTAGDIVLTTKDGEKRLNIKALRMQNYIGLVVSDVPERIKAQKELQRTEDYYNALVENVSDGMVVINGNGAIRNKTASIERVLGYRIEDDIGRSSFDFVHPDDLPKAAEAFTRLIQNPGLTIRYEIRVRHADGAWRTIEVIGKNLLDNPAVAGVVANFRDITEQKSVQEALTRSEEHFRALIENSLEAMVIIDAQGLISYESPSFERLLGYKLQEHFGRNPFEYVHADDVARVSKSFSKLVLKPGVVVRDELRVWHKNGSLRTIEVVGQNLLNNPAVKGVVTNIRDITERRQAEETLHQVYQQEKELRQQLEEEMKRRVEFTRALAHELKTPLTSVLAAADLLVSELHEEPLQTLAKNIRQGASNLGSRIDELLDLARGEVGMLQVKLDWVDILQLLRETADSMAPLASRRGQSLVLMLPPSLPQVRADVARLQQIVTNLINNALKFTQVGGSVKLKARQKNSTIVVEVQDTGRGISKEDQKFLFQPYHRLQMDYSKGLGVGLALCKMLVELQNGRIWVRSSPGKGSTFGFSLPLETAEKPAVETEAGAKLWKVLIIEDDDTIVSLIRLAFQMRWPEAQLISASLGEEGLDLVEDEKPDLVILDLGLPDMDGYEVLRQIRLFSSVPIVILTVRGDEDDIIRGLEWGADDYIVKPFRQLELLSRLKVQLRRQISPDQDDQEAPVVCGPLRLDPSTFQLKYGGKEISLTLIEGHIMYHLMKNAGHVVTHSKLAEAVWGEDHPGATDSLRVYIRHLREKLEADPGNPKLILTKVGVGYILATPA
jgi:two-component system KDP operon response regulator KdpE